MMGGVSSHDASYGVFDMPRLVMLLVSLLNVPTLAFAQEVSSTSSLPPITVKPSLYGDREPDSWERQARLHRRAAFSFQDICTNCMGRKSRSMVAPEASVDE